MTKNEQSKLRLYFIGALESLDQKIKYLEVILRYPTSQGKKHFEPGDPVATFFKSVTIALYTEVCCLIVNHFHNKEANRFTDLSIIQSDWNTIIESVEYKNIKTIRDQFGAHQDSSNSNNSYSLSRSVGEINVQRVNELRKLFDEIVKKFKMIEAQNGRKYTETRFNNPNAKIAAEKVLESVKPEITDAIVI